MKINYLLEPLIQELGGTDFFFFFFFFFLQKGILTFGFSQTVINQWNSLPENVVSSEFLNQFKSRLVKTLGAIICKIPTGLLCSRYQHPISTDLSGKHLTAISTTNKTSKTRKHDAQTVFGRSFFFHELNTQKSQ